MRPKYKFTVLAALMVLVMSIVGVDAYSAEVSQNTGTKNIFVSGRIHSELLNEDGSNQITLMMVDKDVTDIDGTQINYMNQFAVNADGSYFIKFRYNKDAALSKMYLKYKNTVINDSVVSAVSTNQVIDGHVWLTSSDNRAYELSGADSTMPTYTYSRTIDGVEYTHSYSDDYVFSDRDGIKANVQLTNKYGFADEKFDILIAFYDNSGGLISCCIKHGEVPYGEDGQINITDTDAFAVPSGTAKSKAFVLSSMKDIIPYADASDGTLEKIRIFCVGDSTGQDWGTNSYPQAGWGTFIKDYFNTEYAEFVNKCVSGAHAQSILGNEQGHGYGKWKDVMNEAKAGDYIIVSLGINDAHKEGPGGMSAVEWYKLGLKQMIEDAQDRGINIIMCSRIHGGYVIVDKGNSLTMIEAMRSVCAEKNVPFLNIFAYIEDEFKQINDLDTVRKKYFLKRTTLMEDPEIDEFGFGLTKAEIDNHSNTYISDSTKADADANDYTHTNIRGANLTCRAIVSELKKSSSNLRFYLK